MPLARLLWPPPMAAPRLLAVFAFPPVATVYVLLAQLLFPPPTKENEPVAPGHVPVGVPGAALTRPSGPDAAMAMMISVRATRTDSGARMVILLLRCTQMHMRVPFACSH